MNPEEEVYENFIDDGLEDIGLRETTEEKPKKGKTKKKRREELKRL